MRKRWKIKRKKSRRKFTRTAGARSINRRNKTVVKRGGYRL